METAGTLEDLKCFPHSVPQHLGDVATGKDLLSYCSQRQQM